MKGIKQIAIVAVIILAAGTTLFGQKTKYSSFPAMPIDENTKLVTYKKVVPMDGKPEELYQRALKWANTYYYNPLTVVKEDKAAHKIKCVSNIKITTLAKDGVTPVLAGYVYYTLTIEARDNRYRYTITELQQRETTNIPIEPWLDSTSKGWTVVRYDHLNQIHEAVTALMASIEQGMQPEKVITDEW
ncbi:MAG: DUF4468 domain-containing protein [Bacteroidales bacterium]|jgi:hypothetical protein|nr:DUF4468 domain-containing protein [Bacteroidales bacterium]